MTVSIQPGGTSPSRGTSSWRGRRRAFEYQPVAPGGGGVSPNTGGTGGATVVTMGGSGFQTGSTVSFGGAAARAISVNADGTQLTVKTPHTRRAPWM